ncbi:AmmeMemoRadiSam system protein A [Candidatus Peregrinibacteria bacterium]|nr:AmmeMemoRadiSam system protein A [Candidatus Peregrinibacteria bacterium]
MIYTPTQKQFLLAVARQSIRHYLDMNARLTIDAKDVPEELRQKRATFVTLTSNHRLRGCIGHLEAIQPLYQDVIDNAASAAFEDMRFPSLSESEFDFISIEISILSKPEPLDYKDANDLLSKLRPNVDGVIIREGRQSATFLPQVWEELKSSESFLSHLCAKARLDPETWKEGDLDVSTYQVESFEEER